MIIAFRKPKELTRGVGLLACAVALAACGSIGGESRNLENQSARQQWPITGTSADVLAGGILGADLGQGLSRDALKNALLGERDALENGQTGSPVTWQGKNFVVGRIIPQQLYEVGESRCRRYEHIIVQGAKKKSAIGTACKDGSGIWKPLV